MKIEMTPEEHARLHRRRGRQALGLVIAVLVLIGVLTVLHAGVNAVAKLFDDTEGIREAIRQEHGSWWGNSPYWRSVSARSAVRPPALYVLQIV